MASKMDMSLDELVQENNWTRPPKFTKKSKPFPYPSAQKPSVKERLGQPQRGGARPPTATSQAVSDLRDKLAQKQKSTITDLRVKITPRESQPPSTHAKPAQKRIKPAPASVRQTKDKVTQARMERFRQGQLKGGGQSKTKGGSAKPIMSSTPSVRKHTTTSSSFSSDEDANVHNGGQLDSKSARNASPAHPPSYEDTKKITVTISGLNKPLSESHPHRREERLAAAISRSREARQQNYMRNRDEFVASTITTAFASERERDAPGLRGRAYSRSPSPIAQMHMDMGRSSSTTALARQQKTYTTMTTLYISNLSDTVSRNDVAELCQVVGPLEAVCMTAPGVAEVIFKYKDDALEAYRKYNQRNLDGQPMICRIHPTTRGRVAAAGGGGGSYGSRLPLSEPYPPPTDIYAHPHHSGYY